MNESSKPVAELAPLSDDMLPVIPLRNLVLFPGAIVPLSVGRTESVGAAQAAANDGKGVALLLQRDPAIDAPAADDLHRIGTQGRILRYLTARDGTHHLVCAGERRVRIVDFVSGYPYLVARIEAVGDHIESGPEIDAHTLVLRQQAARAARLVSDLPSEVAEAIQSVESPGALADIVASFLDLEPAKKQRLLETIDVRDRLERVGQALAAQLEILELSKEIESRTKASLDERQREAVLREQLRTIQQQLGQTDDNAAEFDALEEAIDNGQMPDEVAAEAHKSLARLRRLPSASGEYATLRSYLDWLTEMPWARLDDESIDIEKARETLDADHYGLDKVKQRIIEHLAVRKLNPDGRSPILCFVGPPGVGKTSLGQSISRALGLAFVRVSLGGLHDESEIRGHRRTYVGALPGRIVQAIHKAGTRNPVFMLDEIDKLSASFHGDPAAALLEVLDPEQNATFQDNYLAVPFDLSRVFFIATANRLDTIPGPLLDRLEIIELSGYTTEEKVEIAKRYLIERQRDNAGVPPGHVAVDDAALERIVTGHTREAGCRALEKKIAALFRHAAVEIASGRSESLSISAPDIDSILGPVRFEDEVALRTGQPGVATGLAWTPSGGDILFVEASIVPGEGRLTLTGQLGDVMKESAQAAVSLLKSRCDTLSPGHAPLGDSDVHVHVPAGAIPKDGPSAGVAMFVSLASMLAGLPVRHDVAMTGEISLRGQVLPVGGIREKTIAAHRAGIRTVLLPARNARDVDDIPETTREALNFVWLDNVDDALAHALDNNSEPRTAAVG